MSRKRSAPGADPISATQRTQSPTFQQLPQQLAGAQGISWPPSMAANQQATYPNSPDFGVNAFQNSVPSLQQEPSNQITRRDPNQLSLAQYGTSSWPVPYQQQQVQQQIETGIDSSWQNNDDELDRKAEIAERNALNSRKSIPPFVQKLSSFLDEEKNTDLIRWSEDGNSFIVLDEDEFAKKLIPELFKHNKYASFVRQLNMYGFHKKVGLSDNSMRASERKSKSPSEYYNPYFKRGRPKLLWLIQKPKTSQTTKKPNADGEDEDDFEIETPGADRARNRQSIVHPNGQRTLSQEQARLLQEELMAIRRNQAAIQEEVRKLREENDMMQNRAAQYQAIHQRHENSINAILTFLATVYRNQLEGRDAQSLANVFADVIPHDGQHGDRVVDLADHDGRENSTQPVHQRQGRRRLLLEAPAENDRSPDDTRGHIISESPPSTAGNFGTEEQPRSPSLGQATSPKVKREPSDNKSTPTGQKNHGNSQTPYSGTSRNDDILSIINSTNANPGATINRLDYPQALSQLQSANRRSPMTTPQRNSLLQLMATGEARNAIGGNVNNALTSPSPPPIPSPTDPQWAARNEQIDSLERSMQEQQDRFNNITNILQPLSPSGSIPGLGTEGNHPPDFDLSLDWDSMINSLPSGDTSNVANMEPRDDLFDFDGFANGDNDDDVQNINEEQGKVLGTAENSEAASPAGTLAATEDGASDTRRSSDSPRKRQRTG